jgi:hypothetical protein
MLRGPRAQLTDWSTPPLRHQTARAVHPTWRHLGSRAGPRDCGRPHRQRSPRPPVWLLWRTDSRQQCHGRRPACYCDYSVPRAAQRTPGLTPIRWGLLARPLAGDPRDCPRATGPGVPLRGQQDQGLPGAVRPSLQEVPRPGSRPGAHPLAQPRRRLAAPAARPRQSAPAPLRPGAPSGATRRGPPGPARRRRRAQSCRVQASRWGGRQPAGH